MLPTESWELRFLRGWHQRYNAISNAACQYNSGPTHHVGTRSLVGGQSSDTTMFARAHFAVLSALFPFWSRRRPRDRGRLDVGEG